MDGREASPTVAIIVSAPPAEAEERYYAMLEQPAMAA
jgi:hypothetical protein